jgi:hypothetical protein
MVFRRLTRLLDIVVGAPSEVAGADTFAGFYLNCRDISEAFPWVPKKLSRGAAEQILHFFHLAWLAEVINALSADDASHNRSYKWLDDFLLFLFRDAYTSMDANANILAHGAAFVNDQKEICRTTLLPIGNSSRRWPLARIDLLDLMQARLSTNVDWCAGRPSFMFLDDYTEPIVTREVQRILNEVVFKRRSDLFFKVSTEAANSFHRIGLNDKPLELDQDFELIDLATESLHQDSKAREELLDRIFRPRIDRHQAFKDKGLGLDDILGSFGKSNNELARQLRAAVEKGQHERILYSGSQVFAGLWSSDVRIMIQIFTEVLRDARSKIEHGLLVIPDDIQDRVYRAKGGEFLAFAASVADPEQNKYGHTSTKLGDPYGKHLRDIVEAFIQVSRYELTRGSLVKNGSIRSPKQAFRIEVIDELNLPDDVLPYYRGLTRWHIFLQDWRGKGVRGVLTPRLYLNRVLIPHAILTFSKHDNIGLTNSEFTQLLRQPMQFFDYWLKKRLKPNAAADGQQTLGLSDK